MKLKVFKIFLLTLSIFLIGTFIYGQSSNIELGPLGGLLFYNISGTNYERAYFKWDSNVFKFGIEAAGSGIIRELIIASPTFTGIVTTPITIFNQQITPAAAADVVKVWAQDYPTANPVAGDTRLYFQSESGKPIIIGNNEIQLYRIYNTLSGSVYTISSFSDYSGVVPGAVLFSSTYRSAGKTTTATIYNTTNYNGIFIVTKVSTNTFYIMTSWLGDDATGNIRTSSGDERVSLKWDSTVFKIITEKTGNAVQRNIEISSFTNVLFTFNGLASYQFYSDRINPYAKQDLGESIYRFGNVYLKNIYSYNLDPFGFTHTITAFSDYGGTVEGTVQVTSATHNLPVGESTVIIIGTTNYNGTFVATYIDANTFYIYTTWLGDDATGTFTTDLDYERIYFKWDSDIFKIGTEAGGSGVVRNIQIGGSEIVVPVGGSIQAAINYAVTQTPSATNLWTVVIMPGVYTEAITMSPYVNLMGSGTRGSVVIFQNAADVITLANHVEVQNLTVRTGTTGDIHTFTDGGVACTVKISDVDLESTYTGAGGWGGLYITGAGDYTLDRIYIRNTATAGGTGDQGFVLINGVAATARITNCNIYMEGAPGGTSSKSILGIIAPAAATIISSGNRYDGDAFCNTFYAESGIIISTNDSILTQYGDQIDPSASVTAGNQKFINTVANGLVATIMTNLGPTGAQTTIQGWIQIKDSGGTTRYIPYW